MTRKRRTGGKSPTINHARKRWVRTDGIEYVHYAVPEGEREGGEGQLEGWGASHILSIIFKSGGGRVTSIELSEMTVKEIDAVKELMDTVFAEAREVCEHRDTKAREAYEDGNDTHYRLYRTVPKVVER